MRIKEMINLQCKKHKNKLNCNKNHRNKEKFNKNKEKINKNNENINILKMKRNFNLMGKNLWKQNKRTLKGKWKLGPKNEKILNFEFVLREK